jgi:hypothetical protein
MVVSPRSNPPLHASLKRFLGHLEDALKDDWGANVFEEVIRHVKPVLADLEEGKGPVEASRNRVSALGAQLEASSRANVFAMTNDLEREAKVLIPLLEDHLESLRVGGAA